jgi:hypothetical protein
MQEPDRQKKLGKSGRDVMAKNGVGSGFKTWLKKKIVSDHRLRLEIASDIDEERCAVGREVKTAEQSVIMQTPKPLDQNSRAHLVALIAASRDLGSIEECMTAVSEIRWLL